MKKLGILTVIDSNHGSSIFNYSLNAMLRSILPAFRISFLRYLGVRRYGYELIRCFKLNRHVPWYNAQRYRGIIGFEYRNLDIVPFPKWGRYESLVGNLCEHNFDAIIVAKVLWSFTPSWFHPRFPNLFWLSDTLPAVKIAYAISGHLTDFSLFYRHISTVKRILSTYALIGVRDDITMQMMHEAGIDTLVPVCKVPDSAFMFTSPTNITAHEILRNYGIPDDKPLVGLLLYGKQTLSKTIALHYRTRGYTVINYNMFNPYAEYNIGHRVDTFEWAELFRCLRFCVTDRFHCSVLCLKNAVPFMAVEPFKPTIRAQSKIFDLLKDFNMLDVYYDVYGDHSSVSELLERCEAIENDWERTYRDRVVKRYEEVQANSWDFLKSVQDVLVPKK